MMRVLIVIPIRANSVGIPRKALRPLGGVSPLVRVIRTAQQIPEVRVVVTTADTDVAELALAQGVELRAEPLNLNPHGTAPLDAAISLASDGLEPIVVTMQATSPFTTVETLERTITLARAYGTCITVRDHRALLWTTPLETQSSQDGPPRVPRQQMPPMWKETGALLATQRQYVTPTSRFGPTVHLLEVTGAEAVDLDAPEDWAIAEWYAGALSTRECLMARVLGDRYPQEGFIVKFSAWDEEHDDTTFRDALLARLTGELIAPLGQHTQDEAQLAARILALGRDRVTDVLLLTSAYHQVRVFLTMLRALQEHGLERTIRLWNVPAASRMDKLADEWRKIGEYQHTGHVASLDNGLAYLDWRDRQGALCAI